MTVSGAIAGVFAFALALLAAAPMARAQDKDIQTRYATQKGACGGGLESRVDILEGRIVGPGFDCALGAGRPAGTGLEAFAAECAVDGKKQSGFLALDLGNYADHFKLQLPGREGWLSLYPCTKVPGLN